MRDCPARGFNYPTRSEAAYDAYRKCRKIFDPRLFKRPNPAGDAAERENG